MSIDLSVSTCQTLSKEKLFGLCDDPAPANNPAYIDETNGAKWIAVVENEEKFSVTFTAIDHCIETLRADGSMDKRCDGVLTYGTTVIFVELKERGGKGNGWVLDAEKQLKSSISYFDSSFDAEGINTKKAYIANKEHPKFKDSQTRRMDQFFTETGYVLRIVNRIILQ